MRSDGEELTGFDVRSEMGSEDGADESVFFLDGLAGYCAIPGFETQDFVEEGRVAAAIAEYHVESTFDAVLPF